MYWLLSSKYPGEASKIRKLGILVRGELATPSTSPRLHCNIPTRLVWPACDVGTEGGRKGAEGAGQMGGKGGEEGTSLGGIVWAGDCGGEENKCMFR